MKKISNVYKAILITVLMLSLLACSKEENSAGYNVVKNPPKDPTSIVTQYSYLPLENSKSYDLNAAVIPLEKAREPLIYSSNNNQVAGVDETGKITTYNSGFATIKVALKNDESIYKNIVVHSYEKSNEPSTASVRAVYVNKTYISLETNKANAYTIEAGIRPIEAKSELAYISTDENVATVSETGIISSKNAGKAAIIVYAKSNPEKYAQLAVEVKEKSNSGSGGRGVSAIDLAGNPLTLIAKYKILEYQINNEGFKSVVDDSNLRVNVILDNLPVVDIIMYTKLNGKEVKLRQRKDITEYNMDIGAIFTSLGANITGEYTMEFTLNPENYSQFYKQGMVTKGDVLVLKIGKVEDYMVGAGLGDVVYDPAQFPVEEGMGEETPGQETGNQQAVTAVKFNITSYQASAKNEKFHILASVEPATAADKTLTWKSSDNNTATVNEKGEVTVLKNGNATITAISKNGKSASLKIIPVTTPEDFMLEIDKQDLILGLIEEFQINPIIYPFIISVEDINVTYRVENENIATVTETGLVRAVAEGETVVYVTIAGIERQCYINVLPKSAANVPVENIVLQETSGEYEYVVGSFRLSATVQPATAGDKRLKYEVTNTDVCEVNSTGLVTFKNPGETTIKVSAFNNPDIFVEYKLKVISTPTNLVFERLNYGIAINQTASIPVILEGIKPVADVTYTSSNTSIATVDSQTGEVMGVGIGSTTITAQISNGLQATYEVHVYTPADINNLQSLEGTYDIVDFTQTNGTLDIGTKQYGGVERMLGEVTIKVEGDQVKMISKIQMNSSKLDGYNGIGSGEAKKGLFQTTVFDAATFKKGGFGSTGSMTKGQVSLDNGQLKVYQEFTMQVIISVTVRVNTWIKKKSDTVKTLNPDEFIWTKDGADYSQKAHATKYFNAQSPSKEPYYAYGLITK